MSTPSDLQQQLLASQNDLSELQDLLADDPDDESVQQLASELQAQIAQLTDKIAVQRAAPPPLLGSGHLSSPPPPPAAAASSLDHQELPGSVPPPPPSNEPAHVTFNVGDTILAKFSQDKQYYQAKVISKTGSPADPVYYVHFVGYSEKENKRSHEVKALESKKRKADGSPAVPTPPTRHVSTPVQSGAVISAAPSLDPSPPAKHIPSKVSDGPTRMAPEPKKLKPNKQLEKKANSWQTFRKVGPKNPVSGSSKKQLGKDSMFRTSDLPNAKVGFVGSGQPMQKDVARTTWKSNQKDYHELDAD